MFAPSYGSGFGPTNNSQPFNPNVGPQNPHQQQQQQNPGQPQGPQGMMFNPQPYSAGPGQSPYGMANPGMGGTAGGMGMMQNSGLAHVPAGPMAQYQTPYTSSPYGTSIPTSTSNLPQNFMPPTSTGQPFSMNAMNFSDPRMQPPPTSSANSQRASPYGGMQQHNATPNSGMSQSQFAPPQNSNQATGQTSNQPRGGSTTPQTPNFPPGSQGASGPLAAPLSPGSEVREKERVTVLLNINSELLLESLRIQTAQAAEKEKDTAATAATSTDTEKIKQERAERTKSLQKEYVECMRRLQGNLAYLAAIADRSHKPSSQIPHHPQVITAPPLAPRNNSAAAINTIKTDSSSPNSDPTKSEDKEAKTGVASLGEADDIDRPERLVELYKHLQSLFPGVDPKKEQSLQQMNAQAMRARAAQAQAQAQAQVQPQGQSQNQTIGGNATTA